jgi:glucose-6-phosphate 1-epimerase
MTIEQLNSRYGAQGRIVFRPGHCGYPNVILANKYGSAEVTLLGANVVSYRPTGHSEVIFRPAKRDYNRGESFHGGIPVCFPQFGNRFSKDLAQHGFARIMPFSVKATEYSDEMTEVTLSLNSDDATRSLWPHDFDLTLKVSVSMKLNITLTVVNTGKEAFDFSCGLHPYLMLMERDKAVVKGLDGCDFFDGTVGADGHQEGDLAMTSPKDHIFSLPQAPRHEFALIDSGLRRAIALASAGNDRLVVWNPGEKNVLSDFKADDWRRFTCVEPVSDWPGGRTLAAGAKYVLMAAIQSTMENCNETAEA